MLAKITHLLPQQLQQLLAQLPSDIQQDLEEIRIREARPLEIGFRGQSHLIAKDGRIAKRIEDTFKPSEEQCRTLLEKISNYSLYAIEEELRRGYVTVAGGHRIGLVGRTILEQGHVKGIRDVGGFNIRIAREVIGAGKQLLPKLIDTSRQTIHSTLIIAPPQQGKTTVIRDLARTISYGYWPSTLHKHWQGKKVAIVDERSEIAACVKGIPTFDIGPRTDVMDACPKAEGMMMMLRSMSPDIVVADEIGRREDGEAIIEASHAGVKVIATAHAFDLADVLARPMIRNLVEEGAFKVIVQLKKTGTTIAYTVIETSELLQRADISSPVGMIKR